MWAWLSMSKQGILSGPEFRRGEGGWVDVGWAFMVVRRWGYSLFIDEPAALNDPRRATMKAHPSPLRHPRPYGF